MSDTATQIAELEKTLEILRRQKTVEDEAAKLLTPEQKLAIVMHNTLCKHNNTRTDRIKCYIAFSIHGTNKFTVATKEFKDYEAVGDFCLCGGPGSFMIGESRRPGYNKDKDGVKLLWSKLNRKDGKPLTDKGWVTRRFKELAKGGWTIVPDKGQR